MTTRLISVTDTGIRTASLAEVVAHYRQRYKDLTGEDLALSPQTPQAQISGVDAAIWTEILEACVQLSNANSVDHAGGVHLSQLGAELGIRRTEGAYSRVTATLTGTTGTGVLAGARARTTAGTVFETLADAILSPGGVQVDMQAVEPGPVAAAAGTLTQIVTVISGWESVTNAEDAALGVAEERDEPYRERYRARTGRLSTGGNSALEAAFEEAGSLKRRFVENRDDAAVVVQEWTVYGHSILAILQSGADGDLERAIETHRGQGVGTMTAIRGGAPDDTTLAGVTAGAVTWNGVEYPGLDLSSLTTGVQRAAALTTLLEGTTTLPASGVTVRFIGGRYVAQFAWNPDAAPNFTDGATIEAFGLDPDNAAYPAGPFLRPTERALAVTFTATRQDGFPADGLQQLRDAVAAVVAGYGVGQQVWLNDILRAVEGVAGTRISGLTAQYDSADVSGVNVPLDALWTLPAANLTINIT